jgi:phospholipid-binding lipoprotein MlaA
MTESCMTRLRPAAAACAVVAVGAMLGWPGSAAGAPAATAAETSRTRGAGRGPDHDPLESFNRRIFWFNDTVDVYVLEPVATGWDRIAPRRVQTSLGNFFHNLRFPIVLVNSLLQGKPQRAATSVARFVVNTTVGGAGLFDPATGWGLDDHPEDFGQTLGWWGVPPGPYLVLPFLGPSNPRDAVGLVGDYGASITPFFVNQFILLGTRVTDTVNLRSLFLQEVRDAKEASLDYYAFLRHAYYHRREALVNDRAETDERRDEDLYDLDYLDEDDEPAPE